MFKEQILKIILINQQLKRNQNIQIQNDYELKFGNVIQNIVWKIQS